MNSSQWETPARGLEAVLDWHNVALDEVTLERHKYMHNLLDMPVVLAFLIAGLILILYGLYRVLFTDNIKGFYFAGS